MNAWQLLQQIQYLLRLAEWTTNVPVFASGSVVCSEAVAEVAIEEMQPPIAVLTVGGQVADEEDPRLRKQDVRVLLGQMVENDRLGESTLIGAARTAGSDGRGLLELEEQLDAAIGELTKANGVRITFVASSKPEPRKMKLSYQLLREHLYTAWLSTARAYQPATQLVATPTSGHAALVWKYPGLRFDTRRAILRRAAGATAPATPLLGTGIVLGGSPDGAGVTSVTDAVAAGTYSYSLWIAYDETGAGADQKYSPACTVTTVVP